MLLTASSWAFQMLVLLVCQVSITSTMTESSLTVQQVFKICTQYHDFVDLEQDLHDLLATHLVSMDALLGMWRIHLTVTHQVQKGTFLFYLPQSEGELRSLLDTLSDQLAINDENKFMRLEQHELHFICTLNISSSSRPCTLNFTNKVPISEQVLLVTPEDDKGLRNMIDIWEIYSLNGMSFCQEVPDCHVSIESSNVINAVELPSYLRRREDLHGYKIRTIAQVRAPDTLNSMLEGLFPNVFFTEKNDERFGELFDILKNGTVRFLDVDPLRPLRDFEFMLNFTHQPVVGQGWPRKKSFNSTKLGGVAAQLMENEADICIVPAAWNIVRAQQLFFLPPWGYPPSALFYRSMHIPDLDLLLLPFQTDLWIATVITFALIVTLTIVVSKVTVSTIGAPWTVASSSFNVVGILMCQGGSFDPRFLPFRIVVLTAALTASVLYMSYGGAFVASVSTSKEVLKTYSQLDRLNFTVFTDPEFINYYSRGFARSEESRQELLANSQRYFKGKLDMVIKVLDGQEKFAVVYRMDNFYGAAQKANVSKVELCGVLTIRTEQGSRVPESFLMRKGSPLRELFSHKTVMLRERGLIYLYITRMRKRMVPPCSGRNWNHYRQFDIHESLLAFIAFFSGVLLAIFFVISERMAKRKLFDIDRNFLR